MLIRLASPRLDALSLRFWMHPRPKEIFPEYLLTLYASMRATVPLLEDYTAEMVWPSESCACRA